MDHNQSNVVCVYCDHLMPQGSLSAHIDKMHAKCPFCSDRMSQVNMPAHIDRIHARCIYCGERMPQSYLRAHIQQWHSKCVICKERMPNSNIQAHVRQLHLSTKAKDENPNKWLTMWNHKKMFKWIKSSNDRKNSTRRFLWAYYFIKLQPLWSDSALCSQQMTTA